MRYKWIFICCVFIFPLSAQSLEEGERYFNNQQYHEAKDIYGVLLKKKPKDKLTNYRYARACFELGETELAAKHFETAGAAYLSTGYYLGEIYTSQYHFDKAVVSYTAYLKVIKEPDKIEEAERKIVQAEQAERLLSRVENIVIVDSLVTDKSNFLNFYKLSQELGELKQEKIEIDSIHSRDKISYTTQRKDRVYFSDTIQGDMNLFTSYKLLDGWSQPTRLPEPVNTGANQNYPFLLLDGVTMYFASDGDNSIGGYDLFITKYVSATNTYLTPENIGMPFNSPYNDYMMVIDELNNIGWFATDRFQPSDKVIIYNFIPNEAKTIIRSEDKDELRRSAQLKTYETGERPELKFGNKNPKINNSPNPDTFEFAINDKVVYTDKSQFKSKEALKKWEELEVLNTALKNKNQQLDLLRVKYAGATDDDRKLITPKILVLENEIRQEDEKIAGLKILIRAEENKIQN